MSSEGLNLDDFKFEVDLPQIDFDKFEAEFYKEGIDISEEEQEIKPFKKTHILLSFPPESLIKIQNYLNEILKHKEIEYEQSSN